VHTMVTLTDLQSGAWRPRKEESMVLNAL
jgi:hypothetical protein